MRKFICALLLIVLIFSQSASAWTVPQKNGETSNYVSRYGVDVLLTQDIATRSGPSTAYTETASYKMKGEWVKAYSYSYDKNGVLWVEIEIKYRGAYRRLWTGAKRMDISSMQLKAMTEEDFENWLGYGTFIKSATPRYGPGKQYSAYRSGYFAKGNKVAVIRYENGFYLTESYDSDDKIFRCWVPFDSVNIEK